MKTFTEAEWKGVHPDYKKYSEGIPLFYTYVKGIGAVWVPVWFTDLGVPQSMKDTLMAQVIAVHGTVELWFRAFHGVEGNENNVQHLGYAVRTYGHPAFSNPGSREDQSESVIFMPSQTGLKDALERMKREVERRGGPHAGEVEKRKKRMKKPEEADESLVTELVLYIENDSELYRQQTQPWILNLARKRYKGRYDEKLAVKALMYLVDAGFIKYRKEFATPGFRTSRATKEAAAKELLEYYQEEINDKVRELAEKTRKPKAKPAKEPKPQSVMNTDRPWMRITIRENASGMPSNIHEPINWKWVAIMRVIAGHTLDVETQYLFEDQYNTAPVLPVFVDDWIAELVAKDNIWAGRSQDLSLAKAALTQTGVRIMERDIEKVINDARPGRMRCQWCGKTNLVADICPDCGKSEYLHPFKKRRR